MNIEIIGPGRAGGALAIAAHRAGHRIVSIRGRDPKRINALDAIVMASPGPADLRIIAVSDRAISVVASSLATEPPVATVHVSGAIGVEALAPLAAAGASVGSFHPLQTFPDPARGADALAGSWIGITSDEPLRGVLGGLARSLGCTPFDVADVDKSLYHAGASAAANFTVASLGLSRRFLEQAGVPFEAVRPLVEAAVANAFAVGPKAALTGPIVRGDVETVRSQIDAVTAADGESVEAFKDMNRATAIFADAPPDLLEELS
ncbi:MAG: Rossmann-like and DUF2520 domain-containing protein [Acidimicrobiia bacterium]